VSDRRSHFRISLRPFGVSVKGRGEAGDWLDLKLGKRPVHSGSDDAWAEAVRRDAVIRPPVAGKPPRRAMIADAAGSPGRA